MHTILITFHVLAMLLHAASKPVIFTHLRDETHTHLGQQARTTAAAYVHVSYAELSLIHTADPTKLSSFVALIGVNGVGDSLQ